MVTSQAEHFCFLEAEQQAIIVDKIIKAGFSMNWVSALDAYGLAVWTFTRIVMESVSLCLRMKS